MEIERRIINVIGRQLALREARDQIVTFLYEQRHSEQSTIRRYTDAIGRVPELQELPGAGDAKTAILIEGGQSVEREP